MIKRIPISKIEIGMYVSADTPGMTDSGFQEQGQIRRSATIEKLRRCNIGEVFIDTTRGKDSPFALPVISQVDLTPTTALHEERDKAEKVYGEALDLVGNMLKDVKLGKAIALGPVETLAEEINNSVLRNPNALLCLSQIREKDRYLLEHSINVGILVGVFARYLGFDRDTVHQMVTGGLLHDIGKIRVPYQILNKPGKLTDEEWLEMRRHVEYGHDVLLKTPGIHPIALEICSQHHERLDGGGYPHGLGAEQISIAGRLASIVDIYDAVTATRVYHQGRDPFKAMRLLHELAGNHLDRELVYNFIRCMSVYPIGSLIELSNGRLGVVITARQGAPDKPVVRTFYNRRQRSYETARVVDLSAPGNQLTITGVQDADKLGISVADFL